jgi:hypothetical protein
MIAHLQPRLAVNVSFYPRSGFSGGGGTSRKSFFLPDRGRAMVGVTVAGNLLCIVAGNSLCIAGGNLACALEESPPGAGREGTPLRALAFKTRRRNETRITAKIANLTHEFESIADS